jgi:5-formyltetrahydrofolate cyclo-ligase
MTLPAAKAEWRARLLAQRRARSAAERHAAQSAITEHLLHALETLGVAPGMTVCLYLPLPSEPLAAAAPYLVARSGFRVLVPVTTVGAPLEWCELPVGSSEVNNNVVGTPAHEPMYDAALVPGPLGVPEPSGPRLGPDAVRQAAVVVVPALATDPSGFRLGRGGGFYDRTLALLPEANVKPVPPRIAVLFDGEADLPVPHEPHDARVSHVLTPAVGLRELT